MVILEFILTSSFSLSLFFSFSLFLLPFRFPLFPSLCPAPLLAQVGFYYVSSQTESPSGYCVHFETGASIPTTSCHSFQSLLTSPWKEFEMLCPNSSFIQGKCTSNVPLSVSISAMNSQSCYGLDINRFGSPGIDSTVRVETKTIEETSEQASEQASDQAISKFIEITALKNVNLVQRHLASANNDLDQAVSKYFSDPTFVPPLLSESKKTTTVLIKESTAASSPEPITAVASGTSPTKELGYITKIAVPSCPRTSIVATATSDGIMSVWTTDLSHSSPSLAYHLNTLRDPNAEASKEEARAPLVGTWTCTECETENSYEEGNGERCDMCDTVNPTGVDSICRTSQVVAVVADEANNSALAPRFSKFLKAAGANVEQRKLADVVVLPFSFDVSNGGEEKKTEEEEEAPEEKIDDPGLGWAGGWVAPNIIVHIIEGVYSGTDAVVVSTGETQCMIRTAFDSTEFATPNQLKAKAPEKNDKAVIIAIQDAKDMKFKGKVGKIVRVTGVNQGSTVSVQAVIQFQVGDPPSKHFTTLLSNLGMFNGLVLCVFCFLMDYQPLSTADFRLTTAALFSFCCLV